MTGRKVNNEPLSLNEMAKETEKMLHFTSISPHPTPLSSLFSTSRAFYAVHNVLKLSWRWSFNWDHSCFSFVRPSVRPYNSLFLSCTLFVEVSWQHPLYWWMHLLDYSKYSTVVYDFSILSFHFRFVSLSVDNTSELVATFFHHIKKTYGSISSVCVCVTNVKFRFFHLLF